MILEGGLGDHFQYKNGTFLLKLVIRSHMGINSVIPNRFLLTVVSTIDKWIHGKQAP
jgi:hypothetical protein